MVNLLHFIQIVGINAVALESVESILLYLRLSISTSVEVARALGTFYENSLKGGKYI
jgi:hypothetical protein